MNPAFRAGNLLVSFRALDTIAVVNPIEERVVWALRGDFRKQHDPKILSSGRMLLYDNVGRGDQSAILELDPTTWQVAWQFVGSIATPFLSRTLGTAQALPNDNILITESDNGRAFEITRDGDVVWEYRSPYRAGPNAEFVASLPEMIRLPPDYPLDWLEPRAR